VFEVFYNPSNLSRNLGILKGKDALHFSNVGEQANTIDALNEETTGAARFNIKCWQKIVYEQQDRLSESQVFS
jgi:hypothetical protein